MYGNLALPDWALEVTFQMHFSLLRSVTLISVESTIVNIGCFQHFCFMKMYSAGLSSI